MHICLGSVTKHVVTFLVFHIILTNPLPRHRGRLVGACKKESAQFFYYNGGNLIKSAYGSQVDAVALIAFMFLFPIVVVKVFLNAS